LVWGMLLSEKV